jgi:hypothetical protein
MPILLIPVRPKLHREWALWMCFAPLDLETRCNKVFLCIRTTFSSNYGRTRRPWNPTPDGLYFLRVNRYHSFIQLNILVNNHKKPSPPQLNIYIKSTICFGFIKPLSSVSFNKTYQLSYNRPLYQDRLSHTYIRKRSSCILLPQYCTIKNYYNINTFLKPLKPSIASFQHS